MCRLLLYIFNLSASLFLAPSCGNECTSHCNSSCNSICAKIFDQCGFQLEEAETKEQCLTNCEESAAEDVKSTYDCIKKNSCDKIETGACS
jgi:hypothetical protein